MSLNPFYLALGTTIAGFACYKIYQHLSFDNVDSIMSRLMTIVIKSADVNVIAACRKFNTTIRSYMSEINSLIDFCNEGKYNTSVLKAHGEILEKYLKEISDATNTLMAQIKDNDLLANIQNLSNLITTDLNAIILYVKYCTENLNSDVLGKLRDQLNSHLNNIRKSKLQ